MDPSQAGPLTPEAVQIIEQAAHKPLDEVIEARPPWPKPIVPGSQCFAIGADIGQVNDPSAVTVARAEVRLLREADWLSNRQAEYETVFRVLGSERRPLREPYRSVAERIAQLARRLRDREPQALLVTLIDATSVGRPVVEYLRTIIVPECLCVAVTLTGGSVWNEALFYRTECNVSKLGLVSRLQALLQSGRILLPRSPEMDGLVGELRDFSLKRRETGSLESGALSIGQHDDLAISLGLACASDWQPVRLGPSIEQYGSPAL